MNEEDFITLVEKFTGMIIRVTGDLCRKFKNMLPHVDDMRQHVLMRLWQYRETIELHLKSAPDDTVKIMYSVIARNALSFLRDVQPQNLIRTPKDKMRGKEKEKEDKPLSRRKKLRIQKTHLPPKKEIDRDTSIPGVITKLDADTILSVLSEEDSQFLMEIIDSKNPKEIGEREGKNIQYANNRRRKILRQLQEKFNQDGEL